MGYLDTYRELEGWFAFVDLLAFDALLDAQREAGTSGDLLEIGVMHGKSAFFLDRKRGAGESLVLCDLFELPPPGAENAAENAASYPGVTRARFDQSAARHARSSPTVIQGSSSELGQHVKPGSVRFGHVDGGHLYEQVSKDVDLMPSLLLADDGWVAFDDFRTAHAPGVAAAVWAACASGPLQPVLLTPTKLYAALQPAEQTRAGLLAKLDGYGLELEEQSLLGHIVARVVEPVETAPYKRPRTWRGHDVIAQHSAALSRARGSARRLHDLLNKRR